MKIKSLLILALIAVATASGLSAQNTTSPYSKFGYGLLRDNATSAQRQMGGVGYAMRSGRQVNVMNPAAYAGMDSLTFLFDMGTDVSLFWRKDNTGSNHDWGGGLSCRQDCRGQCRSSAILVGRLFVRLGNHQWSLNTSGHGRS